MSHILVTGANGFIGSHLVRHLLKLKEKENWVEDIVCMVRTTSDLSSLKGLDVKLVIADLRNPETLVKAVTGATYIFHVAAELYAISRRQFLETNTEGTRNLLDAAAKHASNSLKRFLFVSSQAAAGPAPNEVPITEDREPSPPVSWYAESKLKAEKIVMQYAAQLPVTIVRPCSVYGERDPGFLTAFQGAELRIHAVTGFRKRYTGMIYAPDLVEGMVAAARHPRTVGEIYFLASPQSYTVREVVKTIGKAIDKPWGLTLPLPLFMFRIVALFSELWYLFSRRKPIPSRDKVRDLSQIYWLCTPQKAREHFGWQAQTPLLDGLKATGKYYREEQRKLKKMPEELTNILWIKYFFLSLGIGILIESLAAFGKVYVFKPWWLVFGIVLVLWGLIFGSIAMLTRIRSFLI
ncbi:MAG: NAD-dependent epimerase/dehydratase family protein, partial [candidate division KSB1 bacterium]|nr:NAD-dependent epimerase/dehydratase family protein [candidate division KSB1 bacterium]